MNIHPRQRVKVAWILLGVSLVLGHLNMGAYVLGVVSEGVMGAITNYLSWLAITFTCLDLLATADVREHEEGES